MNRKQRLIAGGVVTTFAFTILAQATQLHAASPTTAAYALNNTQEILTLSECPYDHDHADGRNCLNATTTDQQTANHANCQNGTSHDGFNQKHKNSGSHQQGGHHGRINE